MARTSTIERNTNETKIKLDFNIDGTGKAEIDSGVGFFDHMMNGFARHGLFDVKLKVKGDLEVDCHHTIEDTGIVLGNAIREAAGDKKGIKRYGSCILPMDEALILTAVDISGRGGCYYALEIPTEKNELGVCIQEGNEEMLNKINPIVAEVVEKNLIGEWEAEFLDVEEAAAE